MYSPDKETAEILNEAWKIYVDQRRNVKRLLAAAEKYDKGAAGCVARNVGAGILAVGSELMALQIFDNLKRGHLLISLTGLRAFFENYINVNFIFHHPEHPKDEKWADSLCHDYVDRTIDREARKSKLGNTDLFKRTKIVHSEKMYKMVYADLCNYAHFLGTVLDHHEHEAFKLDTIKKAVYTTTMYQDILMAMLSFFGISEFDNNIERILAFKAKSEIILSRLCGPDGKLKRQTKL